MPYDGLGVAHVGVVRRRGRIRRATSGVIPNRTAPHPHAILVVKNCRVFVTTNWNRATRHRVAELHLI